MPGRRLGLPHEHKAEENRQDQDHAEDHLGGQAAPRQEGHWLCQQAHPQAHRQAHRQAHHQAHQQGPQEDNQS